MADDYAVIASTLQTLRASYMNESRMRGKIYLDIKYCQ